MLLICKRLNSSNAFLYLRLKQPPPSPSTPPRRQKVGGEKAALRQQRVELEDKEADIASREQTIRGLEAKVWGAALAVIVDPPNAQA